MPYCKKDGINYLFFQGKYLMSIFITVNFSFILVCKKVQEMSSFTCCHPHLQVKWLYAQVIMLQNTATVHLAIKQGLIIENFCFKD